MRMQIVIEIDERDFSYCQMLDKYNMGNSVNSAIVNGVILPEHHGRLIDADIVADGFEDNYELCIAVNDTPTIIPAKN